MRASPRAGGARPIFSPFPQIPFLQVPSLQVPFRKARPRPKTLLFCTAYSPDLVHWQRRYRRWLETVRALPIGVDRILIVDDGSPVLPSWPDVELVEDATWSGREPAGDAILFHHRTRVGRRSVGEFPGWYRSYGFAAEYAERFGYERAIHVESDAYLITRRLQDRIEATHRGWSALWCPRHRMPEMAVQVIAGRHRRRWLDLCRKPYESWLSGTLHERVIPWSRIERGFVGDRYGEMGGAVPRDADYAAQTPPDLAPEAYWWMPPEIARIGT